MNLRSSCPLLLLTCLACSEGESDSTTGERIVLHTQVQADSALSDEFTTGTHWKVRLDSAALAIGGLYYFDGTPAFVKLDAPRRRPLWDHVQQFFVGVAHAHPQHYVAGKALGQMIEGTSADLFASVTALPDGEGVTGTYRSGRLVFPEKNAGEATGALDGHIAVASGTASKGDVTVHFTAFADLADIEKSSPAGEIDGSVFDERAVEQSGTVTLTVTPRIWFNLVDFSDVAPGTAEEPTALVAGDVAYLGFALGVAQLSAYHYSFQP
jgi:hypothetical protein